MTALDYATPLRPKEADLSIMVRLSIMMFLQFFVWGAWYVTMGNYMVAKGIGGWIAWAYSVSPIGAIVAPLFVGMVADRFFATERVLGVMHILGAIAIGLAPAAANVSGGMFIVALLLHMLCYMPTINLTNNVSFRNMTNQETQFPIVRVFGTIGWIAANWTVSAMGADTNHRQFYLTAGAAAVLGAFSFFLPHTPPLSKGKAATAGELLGLGAISMLKKPSFLIFILCAFLTCIPLAVYYAYTAVFVQAAGVTKVAAVMSLGQVAEVVFMLLLPLFFARLGVKWMLAIGIGAWALRYGLFAAAAPKATVWLIAGGILLHGICYDFFFVTGFIYTDKRAPKEVGGQAQGLLVLATYGLGMLIGAQLSGILFSNVMGTTAPATAAALPLYQKFWAYPAMLAVAIAVLFVFLFRDDTNDPVEPVEQRGFAVATNPAGNDPGVKPPEPGMVRCPTCGTDAKASAQFCPKCGGALQLGVRPQNS